MIPEALTKDIRSGSFAYDVDANGARRLHDMIVLGVKCIPEGVPKASHDFPMFQGTYIRVLEGADFGFM